MALLIVDDDRDIRESLAGILEEEGYRALMAADAEQAMHVIVSEASAIRLVLLDYRMPGTDGWKLAETLGSGVPIVAMTAATQAEPPPNAVAFLRKPFELAELLSLVRTHDG